MSFMLQEIGEQPDWISRAITGERKNAAALAKAVKERDIQFVVIAARGTSDNAATYAKYLIEIVTGLPVALAAPSVFTLYDSNLSLKNALVIGISQSGEGTDVNQVLASARKCGALTACITNHEKSSLADEVEFLLLCHAGEEKAVAATKTYTTALAVVALLVGSMSGSNDFMGQLDEVANGVDKTLALKSEISEIVERYRYMSECAVLARGINQATALEASLKMTETSYVVAKPYSGADFLHGPIAMVDNGFPCFLYAPSGKASQSLAELAQKVKSRDAEIIVISDIPEVLKFGDRPIKLPVTVNELLSPMTAIIPGQLFAYYLAVTRGGDPDNPRGLKKVTQTV